MVRLPLDQAMARQRPDTLMQMSAVYCAIMCIALLSPCVGMTLNLDKSSVVVTGLSAGAYFASQFHVAYSGSLIGAGIIAGGPYYCAGDDVAIATTTCMIAPEAIDVDALIAAAQFCVDSEFCDPLGRLGPQKVWLFSGTKDTVVAPGVMRKLELFYSKLIPPTNINSTFTVPAEHSWPTLTLGNQCSYKGSPYINKCEYDASFLMLDYLLGPLNATGTAVTSNLHTVSQAQFMPIGLTPSEACLGPDTFVYVPTACQQGALCKVAIVMHGCLQTLDDIGTHFITDIGMNDVAEANNIVLIYPQAVRDELRGNPNGCFDWWGYTGPDYASKGGVQMLFVHNLLEGLLTNTAFNSSAV